MGQVATFVSVEERAGSVAFASNGLKMTRPVSAHIRRNNLAGHKPRGKMVGQFSRSSALNLRRKLACLPSETFRLWGATLTFPAQCYKSPDDFRKLFNKFTVGISNKLKGLSGGGYSAYFGFLWRVELTTGENAGKVCAPHLHCIAWTNAPSDLLQFAADWCAAVERHYDLARGSLDMQVASSVTELTSCQAAFQYVANHTTKHKEEQLGWPGRQWGIYYGTRENRKRLSPILNRFDKKPVAEAREEANADSAELLAHGNSALFKNGGFSLIDSENSSYFAFLRVVRRLIESQLGRMSVSSRSLYFRKKYATRSKRRFYAARFSRSSTLFFGGETLLQLKEYWSRLHNEQLH